VRESMKFKSYRFDRKQFYINLILSGFISVIYGILISIYYNKPVICIEIIPTVIFIIGFFVILCLISPRILELFGLLKEDVD